MADLGDERFQPQLAAEAHLIQWIAGGLAALLLTGGGAWLTYVGAQVDSLREDQKVQQRDNADVRERLKGVETKLEAVDENTKATRQDVQRIRDAVEAAFRGSSWLNTNKSTTSNGR